MKISSIIVGPGARLFTWNRSLMELWAPRAKVLAHPDAPWTPLRKDPRECAVALVTDRDVNVVFPVDRLRELSGNGERSSISGTATLCRSRR